MPIIQIYAKTDDWIKFKRLNPDKRTLVKARLRASFKHALDSALKKGD